jgi:hypothetical protein
MTFNARKWKVKENNKGKWIRKRKLISKNVI